MFFEQDYVIRMAESMKLFERAGRVDFGAWRRWWYASKDEAEKILNEWKASAPSGS